MGRHGYTVTAYANGGLDVLHVGDFSDEGEAEAAAAEFTLRDRAMRVVGFGTFSTVVTHEGTTTLRLTCCNGRVHAERPASQATMGRQTGWEGRMSRDEHEATSLSAYVARETAARARTVTGYGDMDDEDRAAIRRGKRAEVIAELGNEWRG